MSDKITIKEVIGDGFDFLKSSETHDDLKNQMLEAYSNSTEYIEKPIVVYEDSEGEIWELVISIDVVKQSPEHYEGEILLTKRSAKNYVKKPEQGLWQYTSIEDDGAEILAEYKRDISLDGIEELSDAAAESFSKHQGDLSLGNLTELSDTAAESLSKHQGDLSLSRLNELSDASAESLSKTSRCS